VPGIDIVCFFVLDRDSQPILKRASYPASVRAPPSSLPRSPRHARSDRRSCEDAIEYGWNDGSLLLDLQTLFKDIVGPQVVQDAAKSGYRQTPCLEPFGTATTGLMPLLTLPSVQTSELTTDVEPLVARGAVQRILVHVKLPSRDRNLPIVPDPLVVLPDHCKVPANSDIELLCIPVAGWEVTETPPPFTAAQPSYEAIFKLEQRPPISPPKDLQSFNVRFTQDPGAPLAQAYQDLGSQIAERAHAESAQLMSPHEYGPDFVIGPAGFEASRRLAIGWARALRRWAPNEVDVIIAAPGETVEASRPNLRFHVSAGWARDLAGFLGEVPMIAIARSSLGQQAAGSTYSAAALQDLGAVHAEPGRNRIRVELPWGAWTDSIEVPQRGEASCMPPQSIGLPPLRNHAPLECRAGAILVNDRHGKVSINGTGLDPRFVSGEWIGYYFSELADTHALSQPAIVSVEQRGAPPTFDAYTVHFMLPATSLPSALLVDLEGYAPRVEPYSNTSLPEWDLIISCGRLDAITSERLTALCGECWPENESWFLQLGLAYAAYAAGSWNDLRLAIERLRLANIDVVDVDLLDLECRRHLHSDREPDFDLVLRIRERLRHRLFPTFRWGIPLARRLSRRRSAYRFLEQAMSFDSTLITWISTPNIIEDTPTPARQQHGTQETPAAFV